MTNLCKDLIGMQKDKAISIIEDFGLTFRYAKN